MRTARLRLRSSNYLTALLLFNHLGALSILLSLDLINWFVVLGSVVCIFSMLCTLRYHAWRVASDAIVEFWPKRDGQWILQDRRGRKKIVKLCGDSVVTRYFILLNFKVSGSYKKVTVVLCPDALGWDNFRRLRVLLFCLKKRELSNQIGNF